MSDCVVRHVDGLLLSLSSIYTRNVLYQVFRMYCHLEHMMEDNHDVEKK
jgi:hypothetical protein